MRIIAFIQDKHSIKDIMKSQAICDFQAPPPIPPFIDTAQAIDAIPSGHAFEPFPDDFNTPIPLPRDVERGNNRLVFSS